MVARASRRSIARRRLKQGEKGLEICVMCETPDNVIQVDAFEALFVGMLR